MAVLARADAQLLQDAIAVLGPVDARDLRAPETGLVMVRGRIGGGGAPFNLGEATVTRASVELSTGEIGHAYALGSDAGAARAAAIGDALFQRDPQRVERDVILPLKAHLDARDADQAAQTAATKVNFFTMVRGDD